MLVHAVEPAGAVDCLFKQPVRQAELVLGQAALAGLPCLSQVDNIAREMAEQGIERVLLAPCKAGAASCDRRYLCDDAVSNELLYHVQRYPNQFAALAGFNPHDLEHSVAYLEATLRRGLSGLFVDARVLGVPLLDRRMYAAYAKCWERHVPAMIVMGPNASAGERPSLNELVVLAGDFQGLRIVAACETWPSVIELREACENRDNLVFALDGNLPAGETPEAIAFLTSESNGGRCLWGSNGEPWSRALARIASLHLPAEAQRRFLSVNAAMVFRWDQAAKARPFERKSVLTAE